MKFFSRSLFLSLVQLLSPLDTMQRLLRLSTEQYTIDPRFSELLNDYDTVIQGMNFSLPPSVSSIFARPVVQEGEAIEWYSELQGQAQPLENLDKHRQAEVYQKLSDRLLSLNRWLGSAHANAKLTAHQQSLLKTLVNEIESKKFQVFSVNEEPVVVQWGSKRIGEPDPVPAPPPPPKRPFRLWPWLLFPFLALFLGFLALLIWWFLTLNLHYETTQCKTITEPPKNAKMMVAFDSSASMVTPLAVTDIDEQYRIIDEYRHWNSTEQALQKVQKKYGLTRMVASRTALLSAIDKIDPSVDIGLITLKECPAATNEGLFTQGNRAQLANAIKKIIPYGGTPLIDALHKIDQATRGSTDDVYALIISDGEDSCFKPEGHANVTSRHYTCNTAKKIAAENPHLHINVLDIAEQGAANCVAQETGGKVYGISNADEIDKAFAEAVNPIISKEVCTTNEYSISVLDAFKNDTLWDAIKEGKLWEAIHNDPIWVGVTQGSLWEGIKQRLGWF